MRSTYTIDGIEYSAASPKQAAIAHNLATKAPLTVFEVEGEKWAGHTEGDARAQYERSLERRLA